MNSKSAMGAVALIGLLPLTVEAGAVGNKADVGSKSPLPVQAATRNTGGQLSALEITPRPCSDFLNAQGTTSRFFPPVPDYVGWGDNPFTTFGLVDYAGLAARYVKLRTGTSLGTEVTCLVTEGALADGSVEISVALVTTNALGFAQDADDLADHHFKFLNTPTNFGAKAQDVVKGAEPALGPAALDASFRIAKPGDPLPDLLDVVNAPCKYVPVSLSFDSSTFGERPDGRGARLRIFQVGSLDTKACEADPQPTSLIFTKEAVTITPSND